MSDPKHPLLSLWRSVPHHEVAKRAEDILALLAELTKFKDAGDQMLVSEALELPPRSQGARAWAVAARLVHRGPEQSDLYMSWVAVAAVRHSTPAVVQLLLALANRADKHLSRRSFVSWLRAAPESLPDLASSSGRDQWIKQLAETDRPPPTLEAALAADDAAAEADDRGPKLTVLGDGDEWFNDTVEHCRNILREPLPLRGPIFPGDLRRIMIAEFPWMVGAIDRIVEDLALGRSLGRTWFKIRPLLIVGPPGAGKTRLARRLADLAEVPLVVVGAGGSSDNRSLQGTARGYSSTHPSSILLAMANRRCANPLVLVDEIDKASPSRLNGTVQDTLLAMLELETARLWYDEALMAPADLSQVNWLLCANDTGPLQRPLLSRLTVVRVDLPGPEAFEAILGGILLDVAKQYGVDPRLLPPLERRAVDIIRARFRRGASVREVQAAVMRALALRTHAFPQTIN